MLPIQTCSTYPKRDKNTSSVELEIPECIELDGEKILTDTLADKLSVSFEKISHGIEQLLEKDSAYRLPSLIHQSIEKFFQKIRAISDLAGGVTKRSTR